MIHYLPAVVIAIIAGGAATIFLDRRDKEKGPVVRVVNFLFFTFAAFLVYLGVSSI